MENVAKDDAMISSNTSGIPLHQIAEGRSEGFRRRFLGTHFFNPPRYLKLLEIIPTRTQTPRSSSSSGTSGSGSSARAA